MKQDFTAIRGQWGTAASLSVLLCQCCIGLELPEVPDYKSSFLPDVVESVLTITTKLLDNNSNASLTEEKRYFLDGFRDVINGLEMLYTSHEFLCLEVIQSKRFMHILMTEDLEISLFFMSVIESMWKSNRFVKLLGKPEGSQTPLITGKGSVQVYMNEYQNTDNDMVLLRLLLNQLGPEILHSILDEIVFKISASEETTIGRAATRLILTATDRHPTVVSILLSKRYKGLKAYLSKWNNRGFDGDVRRLVALLEAGTAAEAEQMKLTRSATIIQACFRGFRTRERMKQADRGITLLQQKFRQKRFKREQERKQRNEQQEQLLFAEQKKIHGFRSSMKKKLQMLETVPAREVNNFMLENQDQAASKIQAAFRGMKSRRQIGTRRENVQRTKAATIIQRQFHRYREHKAQSTPYPIPPGLTDARRVELQNVIVDHRDKFPTKHRSVDELKELHEKAHSLLANHLAMHIKPRKNEQRRDALLARLKMNTDLLL
ncbi:hypothetical protein QZH41_016982, partial [Actinostola sp. cb2023]